MRELIKISKALSDETRVRMLKLLLEQDICVREMQEIFPKSQSQVSRSLKMLMEAGFLKRQQEGKCVVYVADRTTSNPFCRALLDVLADSFNHQKDVAGDRKRLRQALSQQIRTKAK